MSTPHPLHGIAPGYYWYSLDRDPFCVMHVREHGSASLMGSADEMAPEDVAAFVARGCRLVRIEPPEPDAEV